MLAWVLQPGPKLNAEGLRWSITQAGRAAAGQRLQPRGRVHRPHYRGLWPVTRRRVGPAGRTRRLAGL